MPADAGYTMTFCLLGPDRHLEFSVKGYLDRADGTEPTERSTTHDDWTSVRVTLLRACRNVEVH